VINQTKLSDQQLDPSYYT